MIAIKYPRRHPVDVPAQIHPVSSFKIRIWQHAMIHTIQSYTAVGVLVLRCINREWERECVGSIIPFPALPALPPLLPRRFVFVYSSPAFHIQMRRNNLYGRIFLPYPVRHIKSYTITQSLCTRWRLANVVFYIYLFTYDAIIIKPVICGMQKSICVWNLYMVDGHNMQLICK